MWSPSHRSPPPTRRRTGSDVVVFEVVLILATLLVSLVAGLVFAFAVVAMPGLGTLEDREFLRAFQVMDRVIQNNQPVFMVVWVGSVVALVASGLLAIWQVDGTERVLVLVATALYLFGVQLPTVTINIPLNNRLQALDVDTVDHPTHRSARDAFEARWNRWNSIRATLACTTAVLLLITLARV